MGGARNIGIEAATGDYLAYHSDGVSAQKLEASLDLKGEVELMSLVVTIHLRLMDRRQFEPRELVKTLGQEPRLFLAGQQVNINSLLVSKSDLSHAGLEDEGGRYGEDWQYLMSLVHGRASALDGAFLYRNSRR